MRCRNLGVLFLLCAGTLLGCGSRNTPPPQPVGGPTGGTGSMESRRDAFREAVDALHKQINAPRETIVGITQDEITWNDSCLGCARTGESCTQVLNPGYKIMLRAGDATYEYHTDLAGKNVRLCNQSPTGGSYPGAAATPSYPGSAVYPTPTPYAP